MINVMSFFSRCFQDSLSLAFNTLMIMCLGVSLLALSHLEFVKLIEFISVYFPKFDMFSAIISSNILCSPLLSSPSGTPIILILVCLFCPTSLLGSAHFSSFFFLLRLDNFKCPVFKFTDSFFRLFVFFQFFLKKYLFIYFWLHWVFVAARRLPLVAESGGYTSLWCASFSLGWLLLLQSTGSRRLGSSSCGMWVQ